MHLVLHEYNFQSLHKLHKSYFSVYDLNNVGNKQKERLPDEPLGENVTK